MKKNVASQAVGAQMVSASDGSAFTSSVTVSVTGDAGTQATGSVGSGACTHEGNGYHTYAPAQAETNYDLVAFTFTGTGAIPTTVQIYTTFPQTGDNFARLGAPAGASVSADVAAVKTDSGNLITRLGTPSDLGGGATVAANLADIEAQTDNLPGIETKIDTIDDFLDTEVAAIKTKTDQLTFTDTGQVDAGVMRISRSSESADRLERSTLAIVTGTCDAGGTTTAIIASALSPTSAVNDQFNGRIITFDKDTTTAALRGQATDITDYVHATLTFTVTALTTAPASGDTFTIT